MNLFSLKSNEYIHDAMFSGTRSKSLISVTGEVI